MPTWLVISASFVLAALVLIQTLFLSRKQKTGWLFGVTVSMLAIPYDMTSDQYGYALLSLITLFISVRAYRTWRKEEKKCDQSENAELTQENTP